MLQKSTLEFLIDLELNNNKLWFDANRKRYEASRDDVYHFAGGLIEKVAAFDPAIARVRLEPKHCVTRIFRDVRFSKNKTPYKTGLFVILGKTGKAGVGAFYYLNIEPGKSFTGAGIYCPPSPELKMLRRKIESSLDEFRDITDGKELRGAFPDGIKCSSSTTRVPKDFAADSPAVELLKMKDYYTSKEVSDKLLTSKTALDKLAADFKSAKPLVDFINDAFSQAKVS